MYFKRNVVLTVNVFSFSFLMSIHVKFYICYLSVNSKSIPASHLVMFETDTSEIEQFGEGLGNQIARSDNSHALLSFKQFDDGPRHPVF